MDDLTAADYRLLLSLLKFAIVAPEQRERVQGALEEAQEAAEIDEAPAPHISLEEAQRVKSELTRGLLDQMLSAKRRLSGLCPAGGERN